MRSLRAGTRSKWSAALAVSAAPAQTQGWAQWKTGERVEVPAKKIPFFKPSKELKDLVNDAMAYGASSSGRARDTASTA